MTEKTVAHGNWENDSGGRLEIGQVSRDSQAVVVKVYPERKVEAGSTKRMESHPTSHRCLRGTVAAITSDNWLHRRQCLEDSEQDSVNPYHGLSASLEGASDLVPREVAIKSEWVGLEEVRVVLENLTPCVQGSEPPKNDYMTRTFV